MCTRISVFVPSTANLDALESWAHACGIGLERVPGPEGQWQGTSVLVTSSYCDCGTPIGSMSRASRHHDPDRIVRELRNRGWGAAKIARSLAQKRDATQRRDARRTATTVAALTEWATFLKGAPTHGQLQSIGIYYRENCEGLSAKELKHGQREASQLAAMEPLLLAHLKEGVLYELSTSR